MRDDDHHAKTIGQHTDVGDSTPMRHTNDHPIYANIFEDVLLRFF